MDSKASLENKRSGSTKGSPSRSLENVGQHPRSESRTSKRSEGMAKDDGPEGVEGTASTASVKGSEGNGDSSTSGTRDTEITNGRAERGSEVTLQTKDGETSVTSEQNQDETETKEEAEKDGEKDTEEKPEEKEKTPSEGSVGSGSKSGGPPGVQKGKPTDPVSSRNPRGATVTRGARRPGAPPGTYPNARKEPPGKAAEPQRGTQPGRARGTPPGRGGEPQRGTPPGRARGTPPGRGGESQRGVPPGRGGATRGTPPGRGTPPARGRGSVRGRPAMGRGAGVPTTDKAAPQKETPAEKPPSPEKTGSQEESRSQEDKKVTSDVKDNLQEASTTPQPAANQGNNHPSDQHSNQPAVHVVPASLITVVDLHRDRCGCMYSQVDNHKDVISFCSHLEVAFFVGQHVVLYHKLLHLVELTCCTIHL